MIELRMAKASSITRGESRSKIGSARSANANDSRTNEARCFWLESRFKGKSTLTSRFAWIVRGKQRTMMKAEADELGPKQAMTTGEWATLGALRWPMLVRKADEIETNGHWLEWDNNGVCVCVIVDYSCNSDVIERCRRQKITFVWVTARWQINEKGLFQTESNKEKTYWTYLRKRLLSFGSVDFDATLGIDFLSDVNENITGQFE